MQIQLNQRTVVQKIGHNLWRVVGLVGQGIFFYAEAGSENPPINANNEITLADVGKWRAIDTRRHLIVGHSGKVAFTPRADGDQTNISVDFDGVKLEI